MKEIKEERFKKRENIDLDPVQIPKNPVKNIAPKPKTGEGNERSNERTFERRSGHSSEYAVVVPTERRKTRQSFDIFEDQYEALKKLQLAEADKQGGRPRQKLGEMVQEALDIFIKDKARKLGNIEILRD